MKTCKGTVLAVVTLSVSLLWAGELEPSGPPGPSMRTLEEIYNKIAESAPETLEIPSESVFAMSTGINATIVDSKGTNILGSCTLDGRSNSISVVGFDHEVYIPVDAYTGLPTGVRIHTPLTLVKYWDRASPKLFKALTLGEQLQVEIAFYRINAAGEEDLYYSIALEHAVLVKGRALCPRREAFSMSYGKITWTYVHENIVAVDAWMAPK